MKIAHFRITLAALLLVLLVSVGCSNKPAPSDQSITSGIQAKLFQDPVLKTRDIRVTTANGVVTLAGTVNSDDEKIAAEHIVDHEIGVKQVVDQLAVPATAEAQAAEPAPKAELEAKRVAKSARAMRHKRHSKEMAEAVPQAPPEQPAADQTPAPAPPAPPPGPAPVVDEPPAQPAQSAAPEAPSTVTIPAGTVITVQMIDSVDSATAQPGQEFSASLADPVVVGNTVAIPARSNASVRLVSADSSGRIRGSADLALELHSLTVSGTTYDVRSGLYSASGSSRGRKTAEGIGGGGVLGGLIGAIAGGGKGAAIGAGIGAATGGGVEATRKRGQVKVPSEAKISFRLKDPLTIPLSQ